MKYASPSAFRTALEIRINQAAVLQGQSVQRLRKAVAFDRVLARLIVAAPNRWVVKGGFALDLRYGDRARTTKDLDLGRRDSAEAAEDDIFEALALDLGDYFAFTVQQPRRFDGDFENIAIRYQIQTYLDSRKFESITIDVGSGDLPIEFPDFVQGPGLLAFAQIPRITAPALPLERHVAEKLHAYTRVYRSGRQSTRIKDLIDLALICTSSEFVAPRLKSALIATFAARLAHELPVRFPAPPDGWRIAYRELAMEVSLDADISSGTRLVADFLDPLLAGTLDDQLGWRWSPARRTWGL